MGKNVGILAISAGGLFTDSLYKANICLFFKGYLVLGLPGVFEGIAVNETELLGVYELWIRAGWLSCSYRGCLSSCSKRDIQWNKRR